MRSEFTKYIRGNPITKYKGFSFLELVVFVGVLVVILTVLFISINPSRQYEKALEKQRQRDIKSLLTAIEKLSVNESFILEKLNFGSGIPDKATIIGSSQDQVNICSELVPLFIETMPFDPTLINARFNGCEDYLTGYMIMATTGPVTKITISSHESGFTDSIQIK